jgi:metal-responsive CopG/Arc/MetJ family transcriptional regulator
MNRLHEQQDICLEFFIVAGILEVRELTNTLKKRKKMSACSVIICWLLGCFVIGKYNN